MEKFMTVVLSTLKLEEYDVSRGRRKDHKASDANTHEVLRLDQHVLLRANGPVAGLDAVSGTAFAGSLYSAGGAADAAAWTQPSTLAS